MSLIRHRNMKRKLEEQPGESGAPAHLEGKVKKLKMEAEIQLSDAGLSHIDMSDTIPQ
jgi:hypothetical protein